MLPIAVAIQLKTHKLNIKNFECIKQTTLLILYTYCILHINMYNDLRLVEAGLC